MGKGGGGAAPPTQQTVTQTNLPEYAKPYFTNLMQRAQAESYRGYTPYRGERIAGFTPAQMEVQQETMGMETPGQFGVGTGFAGAGGMQGLQYGQAGMGLGAMGAQAGNQFFGMATDPYATQAFMSPYMQNVVETQKQAAIRDAQISNLAGNLGAARQGTYGGARQLLAQTERERALGGKLGDIQAAGTQKAFEDAQRTMQFGSDLGLRGLGVGLQGVSAGLQGAQQATQAGATLGQLGTAEQAADLQRLTAQSAIGEQQRALEQQKLDTAYADFLRQRDYPMEQLGYFSNILRGVPVQLGSTQTTYAQPPSIASQVGGLGLAGLSIGKMAGAFAEGGEVSAYAPGGAVSSPEELDSMTDRLSDQQLQMQLRTAVPGTPEHLMVAGELQARKTLREKANVPQANPTPVIADLLTGGAMPQMPQMPPQMPQQVAMLPENAGGVAALPAPNMENVEAMAAGGLVAFSNGGQSSLPFVEDQERLRAERIRGARPGPGVSFSQAFPDAAKSASRAPSSRMGMLGRLALGPIGMLETLTGPLEGDIERLREFDRAKDTLRQAGFSDKDIDALKSPDVYRRAAEYGYKPATVNQDASGVEAILAQAERGEGPNVHSPSAINPNIPLPGQEPVADVDKKGDVEEAAGAGIPKLGDALALGRQFAGDTKGLEQQLKELPTAEKAVTEQFDLYKKMGVDLDPYKALKESLEKEKSEEGKAETKAGLMALANFGFSLATQTGPFGQAAGKAGKETLPMYAAELKDLKKLSRERDRTLADIRATDSKMRKDITDAGLAKLEKRREKLESRMDQINDNAARIGGTIYGQNLASQTSLAVSERQLKAQGLERAAARDDRLIIAAQDKAEKTVRDSQMAMGMSPAQKEAEIKRLAASYYAQMVALRDGKAAQTPDLASAAAAELARRGIK
jgi:hypothetical protein